MPQIYYISHMSVFLQFCSEKICRRTCNILLRYDRSGKSQCVQVWEIGCPEGLRTFATINMCSNSEEKYTTSVPRKTSCRRTRRSEWRRREMNYFRYVPSHFQMELTIMFFDILGETVINWGVKDVPNFHFGSASPRIHAWTWILYFFYSLFFSLFSLFKTFRRNSNADKRFFRTYPIRCYMPPFNWKAHTQCVICNPAFCEKMKTNVVALPFFGLGITQDLARPNAN